MIISNKKLKIEFFEEPNYVNERSTELEKIFKEFSDKLILFFANGGDQDNTSIPEKLTCEKLGIKLIEGLGNKIQSSSWLLNN